MASFMEFIFIDSDGDARQTNLRSTGDASAFVWAAFRSYRRHAVDIKAACFLLDYHKANGDLADTIALDATGFETITGQKPLSDAAYRKIDADFWADCARQVDQVAA